MATQSQTDAAQIQLGIGQNQLSVFKQISDSARAVMDNAAQSVRDASNIWEGTVRSAQGYRQQQIDTFFKNEQLKLDDKRIQLDALYKNHAMSIDERRLDIAREGMDIDRAKLDFEREKLTQANTYKPYIAQLNKAAGQLNTDAKIELDNISGRETVIRDRLKNMSTAERLVSGKAMESELIQLAQRREAANKKAAEAANYINESLYVASGGTPSLNLPYTPRVNNPSSFPTPSQGFRNQGMPGGEGFIDSSLFPQPDAAALQEADNFRANIGISEETPGTSYNESQPLTVTPSSTPDLSFQAPIPLIEPSEVSPRPTSQASIPYRPAERPSIDRDTLIGALFSIPADKVAEEAPSVLALATPEDRKYIADNFTKSKETQFLAAYGNSVQYDPNNPAKDFENTSKNIIIDYQRVGGDPFKIVALKVEADNQMLQIASELGSAKGDDGVSRLYPLQDGRPGPEFKSALMQRYNEWISQRGQQVQQSEAAKREQEAKTGVNANGTLNLDLAATLSQDTPLDVSSISLPNMERASIITSSEANRKSEVDAIDEFRKQFVFTEGENRGKLKNSFITFIRNNVDKIASFTSTPGGGSSGQVYYEGFGGDNRAIFKNKEEKESIVNRITQDVINKSTQNRVLALDFWKLIKGKNK